VYIGLPTAAERAEILQVHLETLSSQALADDISSAIATVASDEVTNGFTGADLKGVVNSAFLMAVHDILDQHEQGGRQGNHNQPPQAKHRSAAVAAAGPPPSTPTLRTIVTGRHLIAAARSTRPSLSDAELQWGQSIYQRFKQTSDFRVADSGDANITAQRTALM
jgi:SpoVK/Ycf46/Vps4 family AAA+-type ATPase